MLKKTSLVFVACAIFLLFIFFSYLVHKNIFVQFDFNMTVKIQDHVGVVFDDIFSTLSLIGSFEIATVFLLILIVIRSTTNKKTGNSFIRNIVWKLAGGMTVLFLYGSIHVFEIFGKLFVKHPPPPFMFHRNVIGFLFPSSYVQPGFSYPSGHAARSVFISVILFSILFRSGKVGKLGKLGKYAVVGLVVLFDIAMFVSRVYLGEHWTSDVLGGGFLGLSLGILGIL